MGGKWLPGGKAVLLPRENWRCTDAVIVPNVVGLHVRDAQKVASDAGVKLAQPDPDGPPLSTLTWPHDFWITKQTPPPGARLWKWDSVVVEWTASRGDVAGVREPRRPVPPEHHLGAARDWPPISGTD
jgi:hypothetical protein